MYHLAKKIELIFNTLHPQLCTPYTPLFIGIISCMNFKYPSPSPYKRIINILVAQIDIKNASCIFTHGIYHFLIVTPLGLTLRYGTHFDDCILLIFLIIEGEVIY